MASSVCRKCGYANAPGWRFCTRCGEPLSEALATAGPPPPVPPPSFYPMEHRAVGMYHAAQIRQIGNTKTGILLLLVGAAIGWLPLIGLIGGIISLVGAILVIVGRKAFGRTHARNVMLSLVLVLGGIIAIVILAVVLAVALVPALTGGTPDPAAIRSAFTTYFYGVAAVLVVSSLSSVLFTYELQKPVGRAILWAAWASASALQIFILVTLAPAFGDALAQALAGGTFNPAPLDAVTARAELWGLLGAGPAMLFALANYLAWDRIRKGEIPGPPTVPAPGPPILPS